MFVEWLMVLLGWLAAAVFLVASAYKMHKVARSPLNVRWEVYPVPHEAGTRREYGGSYMEEVDWAKKAARSGSLAAELAEMAREIFLLERVRKHNAYGIWLLSLAMHWGMYLGICLLALLLADALVAAPALSAIANITGPLACVLGFIGACGLVIKRAADSSLSLYTAPIDYFNLMFIALIFVLTFAAWLSAGSFAPQRAYIQNVLMLNPAAASPLVVANALAFELFLIYMPFSKLIHYFAKYFTYHDQLWDDAFKLKGSPTDEAVARQLAYQVNWSAPHVLAGKTWLEQAQNHNLEQGAKK